MDRILRRFKRIAIASNSPEDWQHYAAALERVVGGLDPVENEDLDDANIASCNVPREEEEAVSRDLDILNVYNVGDADGNRAGYMIDVYWEEAFDAEDEEGSQMIEEIESQLSEFTKKLLIDAANAGYGMIVFWR